MPCRPLKQLQLVCREVPPFLFCKLVTATQNITMICRVQFLQFSKIHCHCRIIIIIISIIITIITEADRDENKNESAVI